MCVCVCVCSLPEFCLEASKSYDPEAKQALVKKVKGYWDARSPLGLKSAESMVTKREQLDVALMVSHTHAHTSIDTQSVSVPCPCP